MPTLTERAPAPAHDDLDTMAAGFRAALIFTAGGFTGGSLPQDPLFAGFAPVVDMLLSEGLTPEDCRALLGHYGDPVLGQRGAS